MTTQARFIEGVFSYGSAVRIALPLFPQRQSAASDKFAYKLDWMGGSRSCAPGRRCRRRNLRLLAGDYNVIPEPTTPNTPRTG